MIISANASTSASTYRDKGAYNLQEKHNKCFWLQI